MAIAFVQSKSANAGGVSSLAVTFTSNVTAASLLVAGLFDGGGSGQTDSVTDSVTAGNWNADKTANLATDGDTVGVFSRVNASAGATTVTGHGTALVGMAIHEYSGVATTTPLDQKTSNNTTGTSATSGNVTTLNANELIFGFIGTSSSANTVTHGTGYTARETNQLGHIATEDQIVSATGTFAATFSISSDEYTAIIATYTAAAGGGGVSVNLTGQAITSAEGTPTPQVAYGLSGQAITSALGTIKPEVDYGLTGQSITSTEGSLTAAWGGSATLAGQVITSALGSPTPQVSYPLAGQGIASAEGSLAPKIDIALAGQAITSTEGTITANVPGDVTLTLSGLQAVFSLGLIMATGGDVPGGGSNVGGGGGGDGAGRHWSGKFEFGRKKPDPSEFHEDPPAMFHVEPRTIPSQLPPDASIILTDALSSALESARAVPDENDDDEALFLLLQ